MELEGVPQKARRRLIALIRKLAVDPVPEGAERLSGADKYRLRHEDFRLVYWVDSEGMRVVVARTPSCRSLSKLNIAPPLPLTVRLSMNEQPVMFAVLPDVQ